MNAGIELVHHLSSVVAVPQSGWYGFCLQVHKGGKPGAGESTRRRERSSTTHLLREEEEEPNTSGHDDRCERACCRADTTGDGSQVPGACADSIELCVKILSAAPSTPKFSSAASTTTSYPLPFVHEGVELNESLRIGKVLFLERNATVQVKKQKTTIGESHGLENNGVVRWRLVPHHMAKDASHRHAHEKEEERDVDVDDDDDAAQMFRRPKKKTLICAECRRGFVSLRDISTHLSSRHTPPDEDGDPIEARMTLSGSTGANEDDAARMSYTTRSIWTSPLAVVYNDDVMAVVVKPQGMPVMGSTPSLIRSDLLLPLLHIPHVALECCRRRQHGRKRPAAESASSSLSPPPVRTAPSDMDSDHDTGASEGCGVAYLGVNREGSRGALLRKPRPAHRLDSGTGGLLVIAKTLQAEAALKQSFANGHAHKTYVAIVIGKLLSARHPQQDGDCGVVDAPLSGKPCRTLFRTLHVVPSATFGFLTKVELRPETGRKHQLRRHMQLLGHSILGDLRYITVRSVSYRSLPTHLFEADTGPYSRLCLWAARVRLPHPTLRQHPAVEVDCSIPEPIQWLEFVLQHEHEQMEVVSLETRPFK